MATILEERIAALESRIEHLERVVTPTEDSANDLWWEKISGTFQDDPIYDEAMALGRAYRESQRPSDYEKVPGLQIENWAE